MTQYWDDPHCLECIRGHEYLVRWIETSKMGYMPTLNFVKVNGIITENKKIYLCSSAFACAASYCNSCCTEVINYWGLRCSDKLDQTWSASPLRHSFKKITSSGEFDMKGNRMAYTVNVYRLDDGRWLTSAASCREYAKDWISRK